MQTIHKLRMKLLGCLFLTLGSGNAIAEEEFRMGGKTGDIITNSRLLVVNGDYYYVDRQAAIHAEWAKAPMTLDQLQPGLDISIRVSPASAENSVPHIKEIWVHAD